MAKVVFTDDTFVILAAIPIANVLPVRPNAVAPARASEAFAGQGRRFRCIDQARDDTTLRMPAIKYDVERSE